MNSSSFMEGMRFTENVSSIIIETWFIPLDIPLVISNILVIILSTLYLFILLLDKTCHTVSIMLITNSCLSALFLGCVVLIFSLYTLLNDLKQIQYRDPLCTSRAYMSYVSTAIFNYSFLLQAVYRYITIVYPNRLLRQSMKFQLMAICLTWIFGFLYPMVFIFTTGVVYNVDNQICQVPLRFSIGNIYGGVCVNVIPMSMIMLIYIKLVRYVGNINRRVTSINILLRAQRYLKMVKHIIILVNILLIVGIPYTAFVFMGLFTTPPKYHFRIAFASFDISLLCVMIVLFHFTNPLKVSIMKRINGQSNMVIPVIA